jgi:aminopeptidase
VIAVDPAAFARLLCGYCLDVAPGDQVSVRTTTLAAPLVLAVQRELLEREAWPLLHVELPGQQEAFFAAARDVHLDGVAPAAVAEAQGMDASLRIQAPHNTRALADVAPERTTRFMRAQAEVREAMLAKRWCLTLWPTAALAQQAGLSDAAFADVVARALFLDRPDPVAAWRELRDGQERLIERLSRASELRIEAEGTDLVLNVEGRTWVNSDGKHNMPSGEVFTGPHETSAEGRIRYTIPSSQAGTEVTGIELEFRAGEVVAARAERGDDALQAALDSDPGARRLGEIGIGTNFGIDRPIGNTLFDEKLGGTVHLAVGRSYPETGGVNVSAVHWDMVCDLRHNGRLTADGEEILAGGRFTPGGSSASTRA